MRLIVFILSAIAIGLAIFDYLMRKAVRQYTIEFITKNGDYEIVVPFDATKEDVLGIIRRNVSACDDEVFEVLEIVPGFYAINFHNETVHIREKLFNLLEDKSQH